MTITVESSLFTKDRVRLGSWSGKLSPVTKAFFMYVAQFKALTQFAVYVVNDLTVDIAAVAEPCKLFAIWLKKGNTATDAFFKVFDDATDDSTAGDAVIALPLLVAKRECFYFNPDGLDMAAGMVVGSYTAFVGYNGTTPTTSLDGPNGYVVYGKP